MSLPDIPAGQTLDLELSRLDFAANARGHSPDKLNSLAEDMRHNGQLQEIIVTPVGDRFEVVSGIGRTMAARTLGWRTIRARVLPALSDFDKLRVTFSENEEVEGVSPIYQADLIQEMLTKEDLTHKELAERLGKTEGYVGQYAQIAALPMEVKKIIIRIIILKAAHILQICRLPHLKDQVELSTQFAAHDWSVQELKVEVDKRLGKGKKPKKKGKTASALLPDPLSGMWDKLKDKPLIPEGSWAVEYVGTNAWKVFISIQTRESQRKMGEFLQRLSQELLKEAPPPEGPVEIPSTYEQPSRLPNSPEEQKDFEAAARQGVPAFYAWLYGKNHPYAKGNEGLTWDLLGFDSPEAGAKEMLAAIRENRPAVPTRQPGGG